MKAITVKSIKEENIFIEKQVPHPKNDELLIKTHAIGVNRLDGAWINNDNLPQDKVLGVELSGEVVDPNNSKKFHKGDRVIALVDEGSYSEYISVPSNRLIKLPDKFSYVEGASIPENYLTAFQVLFTIGHLKENQSVLIHAGASGVGMAATQLAKNIKNVKVITTSSKRKTNDCLLNGADYAIDYSENDFSEEVKKITKGQGVDLVIDFIGKNYFKKNIESTSTDGTIALVGTLSGSVVENIDLFDIIKKHINIVGTLLSNRTSEYKHVLTENFENMFLKSNEATLLPKISKVFAFQDAKKALTFMNENKNVGKIIISLDTDK